MAAKIRLQRMGKIRTPQYRVVIQDSRTKRSGSVIENIGIYQPKLNPSLIEIDSDRAQYWLGVGAQPTEPVLALLKVTGDWQKFKGISGAEGTLKPQPEKESKQDLFNQALKEAAEGPTVEAITEKKKASKAAAEKKAAEEAVKKEAEEKAAAEAEANAEQESAPAEDAPSEDAPAETAESSESSEAPAEDAPQADAEAKAEDAAE